MDRPDDALLEDILEKPYWIMDILPKQVPPDAAGQYFAVEKYYLQKPRIVEIRRKYLAILLKLNCYYDLAVSAYGTACWKENPEPAELEEWLLTDAEAETLHVMVSGAESLLVLDFGDTYMTVYNPTEALLRLLKDLAASEGLFLWQPE